MSEPRDVPDFYGYGSDITVSLTTGKTVVRGEVARETWRDSLCWLRLALLLPWIVIELFRCAFGMSRPWLGQIECETKDREKVNDLGHIRGCDCGECARLMAGRMLR